MTSSRMTSSERLSTTCQVLWRVKHGGMKRIVAASLLPAIVLAFHVANGKAFQLSSTNFISPQLATKPSSAQASGKKEHVFRGVVEKVNVSAGTLTVNGENVPGWMPPMTMEYHAAKADFAAVKAGDHITAKVFDG